VYWTRRTRTPVPKHVTQSPVASWREWRGRVAWRVRRDDVSGSGHHHHTFSQYERQRACRKVRAELEPTSTRPDNVASGLTTSDCQVAVGWRHVAHRCCAFETTTLFRDGSMHTCTMSRRKRRDDPCRGWTVVRVNGASGMVNAQLRTRGRTSSSPRPSSKQHSTLGSPAHETYFFSTRASSYLRTPTPLYHDGRHGRD
jgi:hypothetical protein